MQIRTEDPTCERSGYTVFWCECGNTYEEDDSSKPAIGHNYTSVQEGTTIHYTCQNCGDKYWESTVEINDEFKREVANYVVQYINQYRVEQGAKECEILPGMTLVAEYRADQLTTNFEHDAHDVREAHAYYEYGVFHDMTQYGFDESYNYWESSGHEACSMGGAPDNHDAESVGRNFAYSLYDSATHWSYLGDDYYSYIAAGVEYNNGIWYVCVMVNPINEG